MEMSVQLHVLAALPSRERHPGTCRIEEWVELIDGLDVMAKRNITDGNRTPEA
jgi:hypothetical protein